jgi:hypothetical protein
MSGGRRRHSNYDTKGLQGAPQATGRRMKVLRASCSMVWGAEAGV